jgi:predicted 3-demethylubiquinone-9 3-methyltransferase (glyoxalase superfamily)
MRFSLQPPQVDIFAIKLRSARTLAAAHADPDRASGQHAFEVMMKMGNIDLAAIKALHCD